MTDIYTVTCFFKSGGNPVQLTFTSKDAADVGYRALTHADPGQIWVEDAFGITALIDTKQTQAIVLTHVNRYLDGQREASLMQARAQAMTQRAAQNDPMLKAQAMVMPGAGFPGGGRQ